MIQAVVLFLVAMLVLALYGKMRRGAPKIASGKCPRCGRHCIGKGPCSCEKGT